MRRFPLRSVAVKLVILQNGYANGFLGLTPVVAVYCVTCGTLLPINDCGIYCLICWLLTNGAALPRRALVSTAKQRS